MTPRTVTEYEARLDAFGIERAEEARAVRVGEKETSEQAAIVARYADLFTQEQLDALRAAEAAADDAQREAVARLRLTCQDGIVTRELAEDEDALENALLGARVPWDGDELPLRSAQARLAVEPDYARRERARRGGARRLDRRSTTSVARCSPRGTRSRATSPGSPTPSRATRTRRAACCSGPSSTRSTPPASRARRRSRPRASTGSTGCWGRSATTCRPRRTPRGSAGSPRSRRPTRRRRASRSASRRSPVSASTSRPSRGSAPTSTTGRRSRRGRASSRPIRRGSCT